MEESKTNLKDLIGQRICLTLNKRGTLRYYGTVNFAPGNWCGIELDCPEGDNDGSIYNRRYFTCKKNHGVFCQVSEILTNYSLPEVDYYIVPTECTSFQKKNLSYPNIAFTNLNCNEGSTSEISSSKISDYHSDVGIRINKEKVSPKSIKETDADYDSDESLGILSLDSLADENELLSETYFNMLYSLPVLEKGSEKDFDKQNAIAEDAFNISGSLKHITPPLNTETLCSFKDQGNLNTTHILDSHVEPSILNETFTLHNCTFVNGECKKIETIVNIDNLSSPKIFRDSNSDESPGSPSYCSTPKHEDNYTLILDKDFLNSVKGFSSVLHPNKAVIQNGINNKTVFLGSDELGKENIFMQNIGKPLDYQRELNKTFSNVCSDEIFKSHDTVALNAVTFSEEHDNAFELELNKTFEITESNSGNILNTGSLSKNIESKFKVFNLKEEIDSNTKASDSSLKKNATSTNTLNTPSKITSEKTLGHISHLPKFMRVSEVQKRNLKESTLKPQSKIAVKVSNSSAAASYSMFNDKKKTRKFPARLMLRAEKTDYKKPKIDHEKSSSKPEVTKILKPPVVNRTCRSSLPMLRKSLSSIFSTQEHKISLTGASKRRVLALTNISEGSEDPGSSYENRKQSLSSRGSLIDRSVKKFGRGQCSQNKVKDRNDESPKGIDRSLSSHSNIPSFVSKTKGGLIDRNVKKFGRVQCSQNMGKYTKVPSSETSDRSALSISNITTPVSKKKGSDEKSKTGALQKRNSCHNFR